MNNNKIFYQGLILALGALNCTASLAGSATIPNSFTAGEKAVASDVNNNFTALKSAIDDNDSRISNMETGFVSISPAAFQSSNLSGCEWQVVSTKNYGNFKTGSPSGCDLIANVQLPHNASITTVTCYFYDGSDAESINGLRFTRHNLTDSDPQANSENIYVTAGTNGYTSASPYFQGQSDSVPTNVGDEVVDNQTYVYQLRVLFSETSNVADSLRVTGCTIGYQH